MQRQKISGNAQFTDRKNLISHGTLLFNADLDLLRHSLKENEFPVFTKAPKSVRSSIANIQSFVNGISTTEELKNLISTFAKPESVFQFNETQWNAIEQSATEKFKSYEWVYGRSPQTKITRGEIEIVVEDGIVTQLPFATELVGVKYCASEIRNALQHHSNSDSLFNKFFRTSFAAPSSPNLYWRTVLLYTSGRALELFCAVEKPFLPAKDAGYRIYYFPPALKCNQQFHRLNT